MLVLGKQNSADTSDLVDNIESCHHLDLDKAVSFDYTF